MYKKVFTLTCAVLMTVLCLSVASAQTEVIVDNADGGYSEITVDTAWTSSSYSTDRYGADYRYNSTGAGNDKATWEASIPSSGSYEVYVYYPQGSNRPVDAPYTVNYEGGSQTFDVNQTVGGGQWNLLGTFSFNAGNYTVQVTDGAEASKVVMADAVRWYKPSNDTPTDTPLPTNTPVTTPEGRVVWIDVWGANTEAKIVTACQKAAANNMNGVAIEVRYRGDALYVPNRTDSTYPNPEPRSQQLNGQPLSFDPLQTCIDEASSLGLEVHAWVVTNCIWSSSTAPTDSNHVFNAHPEWITEDNNGVTMSTSTAEGAFVDPGRLDVRAHTLNVFKDICMNYDIDGLHLDYIRYPGTSWDRTLDWGYDSVATNRYTTETGRTASPTDSVWQDWKRDQITAIVSGIWDFITTSKPDIALGVSIWGSRSDGYGYKFQDGKAWSEGNMVDVLYPMSYSTTTSTVLSQANDWFQNSGNKHVFVGLKAYDVANYPPSGLVEKVNQIRASGYFDDGSDGFSFFDSDGLQESGDAFYDALLADPMASWEQMPPIPSRQEDTPTPTNTSGTPAEVIVDDGDSGYSLSGSWYYSSGVVGAYNEDYNWISTESTEVETAEWRPDLQAGTYDVYVMYKYGTNRAIDAPYTVYYNGGSQTIDVNQTINNDGSWVQLGSFDFAQGTGGYVKLGSGPAELSKVVIADAVRWVPASGDPTSTPTDTPTDEPTDTPTDTPTDGPTNTPSDTPTNTPTDEPTSTPTDTPTQGAEAVDITYTYFQIGKNELTVRATSSLQPNVTLTLVGYGTMSWTGSYYQYQEKKVSDPGSSVTVTSSGGGSDTEAVPYP